MPVAVDALDGQNKAGWEEEIAGTVCGGKGTGGPAGCVPGDKSWVLMLRMLSGL